MSEQPQTHLINLTTDLHVDVASSDGLKEAVVYFREHGWNSSAAAELLTYSKRRFGKQARLAGLTPDEAPAYAYEAWATASTRTLLEAQDLWAWTAWAVRNAMNKEDQANRLVTSTRSLRKYQDTELIAVNRTDPVILAEDPYRHLGEEPITRSNGLSGDPKLIACRQVLVMCGFDEDQQVLFMDTLADRTLRSKHRAAAVDVLSRRADIDNFPITATQWRALVALFCGTPKSLPGLIELLADGHPNPLSETHIKRQIANILATDRRTSIRKNLTTGHVIAGNKAVNQ